MHDEAVAQDGHSWLADWLDLGRRFAEARAAGRRASADDELVLDALAVLREARTRLDDLERRLIVSSRQRHVTWRRIASALGVGTPQAAQQRFLRVSRHGTDPGFDQRARSSAATDGGRRD